MKLNLQATPRHTLIFLSKRDGSFYVNGLHHGKYRLENGQAINQDSSRNTSEQELLLRVQSALISIDSITEVTVDRQTAKIERSIFILAAIGAAAAIIAVILFARHAPYARPPERDMQPPI